MNEIYNLFDVKEGFRYNDKHTKEFRMILRERQAPTPEEKRITEDVPYMQGVYDFSMVFGERTYYNRSLTYVFEIYERDYERRKVNEAAIKNWLLNSDYAPLYDDFDRGYYYIAKCTSVDIQDEHSAGRQIVTINFDAYPFKISQYPEGHDIWDVFNFELDVSQPVEYTINGTCEINILNIGLCSVVPIVTSSSSMKILKDGVLYNVPQGESKNDSFRLKIGENPMTVTGYGTIKFTFYKELI